MHIGDITAEDIERAGLDDKVFEGFVRQLLTAERNLRHRPDAKIRGPVARYRGDQKRDLIFEVSGPPRVAREGFTAALTWDALGQVWYSCKGGGNWERSFLDELGRSAVAKGKSPGAKVKLRPPAILLQHLKTGGRFVFVVAEGTLGAREFLDKMTEVLGAWLDHEQGGRPPTLREQLEIIDAHDIADFIRTHKPEELGSELREALGVSVPVGLELWQQWTDELGSGRDIPEFESDPERDAVLSQIADPCVRVLRVFGPPGVGKTRLVHEGIRRLGEDARARVRYCKDLDLARKLGSWREAGDIYLVLDELRTIDVEQITPDFEANANHGARLFLGGTSDDGAREQPPHAFLVKELTDEAIERLIAHEYRSAKAELTDEQVALIRTLSENYPWYAVLLSRALATEPTKFEHGEDESSRWSFGARRVLAGNPGEWSDAERWNREAELRAKCLLVAMMTRDLEFEWEEIWDRHGPALAAAVGEPEDAHEVRLREKVCRDRQLLRQSGVRVKRRYVSPNNLARLILNHFFTDPDLGPKLRRYAPEFRGVLLTIAKHVQATPALERLALGEWEELRRRGQFEDVDSLTAYSKVHEASYRAAVEVPEHAARAVSEVVLSLEQDVLVSARDLRSALRGVLAHVIHRSIIAEAFLLAEAALFRLAQVEADTWANNATEVWKSLFLPGMHHTHQDWPLRLQRLDEHLQAEDPAHRLLALDALDLAVVPNEQSLGHTRDDQLDGDWQVPTLAEYRERKNELWRRLLDACEDVDHFVVARAREIIAGRLRAGLGHGLYATELQRLSALVIDWSVEQRQALADSLADVRRYDADGLAHFDELLAAFAELEGALAPVDLHERIVAQVGHWSPGPWRRNDERRPEHERALDRQLARELLDNPEAWEWATQWLTSLAARRKRGFWQALGTEDRRQALRGQAVEVVRGGADPTILTAYLLGQADELGPEAVESWLVEQLDEPALAPALAGFLVMQTPSKQRLEWLQRLLPHARGRVDLGRLAYRHWSETLEFSDMSSFVRCLAAEREQGEAALMLTLELLDRWSAPEQRDELLDLLEVLLHAGLEGRVVIAMQLWFEQGLLALARAGRFAETSALVVRALDVSGEQTNVGLGHGLVAALIGAGFAEPLWPHLAAAMLEHPHSILTWQLAKDRLLAHIEPGLILEWVGKDPRRARIAAALANPHAEQLGEVARQLLIRFGPNSEVARALTSRAWSSPKAVAGGSAIFERQQLANASHWTEDPHPAVRSWARRLVNDFEQSLAEHEARSEFRRRYG